MKTSFIYALIAIALFSCKEKAVEESRKGTGLFTYIPSSKSGVTFQNTLSNSEYSNIIVDPHFYDGAGVAVGDVNNDKLPDIYFVSNQWENKLYLNKGDFEFEDITQKAGIAGVGGWETNVSVIDVNQDGWLDLKVDEQVYINNQNLTFTAGSDTIQAPPNVLMADINNDGAYDQFSAGQFPYDDKIIKTTLLRSPNSMYINVGENLFIDIAWYAGVAATDWSWRPLIADFDQDGLKDIFIPSGIVGRVDDLDYLKSIDSAMTAEQRYTKMLSGAAPNSFFRQKENLIFEDVTGQWIGKQPGFSSSAASADLDNDGDLDIVVNNVNSEAYILRNDLEKSKDSTSISPAVATAQLLESIDIIRFRHIENDFNTFDKQPIIPFTNATRGPKMSVGDINGDKLDDVFIAGGQTQPGAVFIQRKAGKFIQIPQPAFEADKHCEETCSALFDIDGDRDLDLMIGSGGEEFLDKRILLRLYINNGRGTFKKSEGLKRADLVSNLQKIYVNASCIVPADVDNDGDKDVFIGGGTVTGRYGVDSDSFILLNDGKGLFTEGPLSFENRQRPGGMVQAASWVDLDGDKYPELITAGEWMTVTIWKNDSSVLKRQVANGLDSAFGWWNSLAVEDMDGDGDADIIAGNFGLNGRIRPSVDMPVNLVVSDIDKNGSHDPLVSYYNNGQRRPLPGRDLFLKQVPSMERMFPRYSDYANVQMEQLVTSKVAAERYANTLASTYFENQGNGKFIGKQLPPAAQFFPVMGIKVVDVNEDGKKDIILVGNLGALQEGLGNYNGGYGTILLNKGNGQFENMIPLYSGFVVKGEGRDIQTLTNFKKERLYLVTRNNDSLLVFKKKIK